MLLFISMGSNAQTISYEDFKALIPYMEQEDWKNAFKQSAKLLDGAGSDSSDLKAIVLYMNILSSAGLVTIGQMTHAELDKHVVKFQGQKIVMSSRRVKPINFTITDSTNEAFFSTNNIKGTNILCFEKFYFNEKVNVAALEGAFIRFGGILEKIETNPNKSKIWILRLTVKNAFARKAG